MQNMTIKIKFGTIPISLIESVFFKLIRGGLNGMKNAIIVVDYQFDFANPEGCLYVKEGETLQNEINYFVSQGKQNGAFIIASKDWHPQNHFSFQKNGGQWPPHCIENTKGSELCFDTSAVDVIINKGKDKSKEEYSCVIDDSLLNLLKTFDNIFVCGLAKDFCVLNTALACPINTFDKKIHSDEKIINTYVVDNLTKSVFPEQDTDTKLKEKNIKLINMKDALKIIKGE
jgi:nicotinamidase/pyrazinamidase